MFFSALLVEITSDGHQPLGLGDTTPAAVTLLKSTEFRQVMSILEVLIFAADSFTVTCADTRPCSFYMKHEGRTTCQTCHHGQDGKVHQETPHRGRKCPSSLCTEHPLKHIPWGLTERVESELSLQILAAVTSWMQTSVKTEKDQSVGNELFPLLRNQKEGRNMGGPHRQNDAHARPLHEHSFILCQSIGPFSDRNLLSLGHLVAQLVAVHLCISAYVVISGFLILSPTFARTEPA